MFGVAPRVPIDFAVTVLRRLDREDRPAALSGSAVADIKLPERFSDPTGSGKLVVVIEFFTAADRPHGMDKDPTLFVERLAIGVAGMIDILGIVAANAAVNGGIVVDREEKRMVTFHVIFVIALRLKIRTDPFTDIFRDPLSFSDSGHRERAAAVNTRAAYLVKSAVVLVVEVCQNLFPWYPAGMYLRHCASGILLVIAGL